jgi:hypothetical protein
MLLQTPAERVKAKMKLQLSETCKDRTSDFFILLLYFRASFCYYLLGCCLFQPIEILWLLVGTQQWSGTGSIGLWNMWFYSVVKCWKVIVDKLR